MSAYIYRGEPEQRIFGALPEGDYSYVVTECGEPYQKDSGNWVVAVKLSIQPSGIPVFAHPWSGTDKNGEERDGIADFLCSCNRAPKIGQEPDWKRVGGARGRLRLKVEIAQLGNLAGKEVNKVHYFYRPKEAGPAVERQQPQNVSKPGFDKAAKQQARASAVPGWPDLGVEPDDIPF